MHTSLNKCELLAEQIVTDVPYNKAKFNPDDFKLSNGIKNEYNFLLNYYDCFKRSSQHSNKWNKDSMFYIYSLISYILWYEINVQNNTSEAIKYATQILKHKEMEAFNYV